MSRHMLGFSVLELLIATGLMVIVMTLTVPAFSSIYFSNQLTAAANSIVGALEYAKTESSKLDTTVSFCHSNTSTRCHTPPSNGNWVGWIVAEGKGGVATNRILTSDIITSGFKVFSKDSDINDTSFIGYSSSQVNTHILFSPFGLIRDRWNRPMSGRIRICTAPTNTDDNIRDVYFDSGGEIQVVRKSGNCE